MRNSDGIRACRLCRMPEPYRCWRCIRAKVPRNFWKLWPNPKISRQNFRESRNFFRGSAGVSARGWAGRSVMGAKSHSRRHTARVRCRLWHIGGHGWALGCRLHGLCPRQPPAVSVGVASCLGLAGWRVGGVGGRGYGRLPAFCREGLTGRSPSVPLCRCGGCRCPAARSG